MEQFPEMLEILVTVPRIKSITVRRHARSISSDINIWSSLSFIAKAKDLEKLIVSEIPYDLIEPLFRALTSEKHVSTLKELYMDYDYIQPVRRDTNSKEYEKA
jgi:hypothetical protein